MRRVQGRPDVVIAGLVELDPGALAKEPDALEPGEVVEDHAGEAQPSDPDRITARGVPFRRRQPRGDRCTR